MRFENTHGVQIIVIIGIFIMMSCNSTNSGDESEVEFEDGISHDIRELLGDELLEIIENDLEMPIHRGQNPPDFKMMFEQVGDGGVTFHMEPVLLLKTNVPSANEFEPGTQFYDYYVRLSNQDMNKFTVDFDAMQPTIEPAFGPGSFIIGSGNKFSVFGPQESAIQDGGEGTLRTVNILSATVTEQGIASAYFALVVIDNAGRTDLYIPNNTGRSFEDGDGSAPIASWPEAMPSKVQKLSTMPKMAGSFLKR